jgi:response regulator of citrate/malate metabolism
MQRFDDKTTEATIIELLKKTPMAVSTDYVAHHTNMSWATSRAVLLNMALKRKIQAEKTTKSMIFRLPNKEIQDSNREM